MRKANSGRPPSVEGGYLSENFGERHVVATEYVPLSAPSLFEREQMSFRDIIVTIR
jgi:hypothetical protein